MSNSMPPISEDLPQGSAAVGRTSRPVELEDFLNRYVFHPLAWRLARGLSHTPVTPNTVSVLGGLCVVAAAIVYVQPGWSLPALIGFLLHLTWHVVDGADDDLARLTGRSSPMGEMVDGICDYSGHVFLYLVLGWALQQQIGAVAWLFPVGAGASRVVQSNNFEVRRRQYLWWVYGVPWMRQARSSSVSGGAGFPALFRSGYLALANRLGPDAAKIDAIHEEVKDDPARQGAFASLVQREVLDHSPRFQLLNANHRTVVLGISMLAGSPIYFFIYEMTVLNVLLLRSIGQNRIADRRIVLGFQCAESTRL